MERKNKVPWASKEDRCSSLQVTRASDVVMVRGPAKDQRCRPAPMGVWLVLTNTFKLGPRETTESSQATDPGMTQAWQMLTFLCHGFPQSWAFHQEWALLVTDSEMGGGTRVESEDKKNRVEWTQHDARDQDKAWGLSSWIATGQDVNKTQKTMLHFWKRIVCNIGAGS